MRQEPTQRAKADPRRERRKNTAVFKKYLPLVQKEMQAVQQAYEANYPGELARMQDPERWELLGGENRTRRAVFYRRLFFTELYCCAMSRYIQTNGMEDMLKKAGMDFSLARIREMASHKEVNL